MGLSDRVLNIVAFLRAGYPSGAPALGHSPLLALLPRRVTDEEISTIARRLLAAKRRSIDHVDVGVEITRATDELPLVDDVKRVQRRLSAIGSAGGHHG